jgi:hypothetical protein
MIELRIYYKTCSSQVEIMKVLIPIGKSKNIIATIAIGGDYYNEWLDNAYPSWKRYCEKHDLGLIIFDENLISKDDRTWKKPTWQKMLIAETLNNLSANINNVCYLDTDILINDYAPNVFNNYDDKTIGLVSQIKHVPFNVDIVHRRVSFLRHTHYDKKYPLDSSIFMSISDVFKHHNLEVQDDYACMGFIIFNIDNHAVLMRGWFDKYDRNIETLTGGGDEPHINFEIQSWGKITWLDYKFQALWNYEMATKYPFLYSYGRYDQELIKECINASLIDNYFLHFAGSWYESDMWKHGDIFLDNTKKETWKDYYKYLETEVTGKPSSKGQIKPSKGDV